MMLLGKIVVDKNAGKMEELVLLNPRDWKPRADLRRASKVGLWGGSVGEHVKCCWFFSSRSLTWCWRNCYRSSAAWRLAETRHLPLLEVV